jgi:hypothetical protein
LLLLVLLGAAVVPAHAREAAPACHPVAPARVVVTPTAGAAIHGTLLCLTGSEVVLARNGEASTTALASVRRIETLADPVWDGAVKGGVIPIVMWLVFCGRCDAEPMLRAAAAYATIGAIIDGLDAHRTKLYDGGRKAAITWRLRF